MRTISHLISAALPLYLVCQPVSDKAPVVHAAAPVDTIAIVDVSGSMSWDLPAFKRDLKNLLPRVLKAGDTFTLVYFSGGGESAVLLDRVQIREGGQGLLDVSSIHATIDRLDTIGLTCFDEPLALVANLAMEGGAPERTTRRRHVIFGSDGYDNSSRGGSQSERRRNILAAITKLTGVVDRVTTMGVGYGCDQGLLQEMAATAGGSFMFARDVASYSRDFEAAVGQRPSGAKRKRIALDGVPVDGIAWTVSAEGEISQYQIDENAGLRGVVHVAENVGAIWYLSNALVGAPGGGLFNIAEAVGDERTRQHLGAVNGSAITASYAAIVLFAQRSRRKLVRALAAGLGDARFVEIALGCFGPQRYNAFADVALEAVKDASQRWTKGIADPKTLTNDPHAYTVLDALRAIEHGQNRVVVEHEGFKYTPITRGRISSAGIVTADDLAKVAELTATITAGVDITAIDAAILGLHAIKAGKAPAASYTYLPAPDGYPVDGVVPASEEANVSIRVKRAIVVDLSKALAELPESLRARLPTSFTTHRYSQYGVITGRVLNLSSIPMILDVDTWTDFVRAGILVDSNGAWTPGRIYVVDLAKLPMVNDAMLEGLSAKGTVRAAYDLAAVKGARKVFEDVKRKHLPKESSAVAAWVARAGLVAEEAAAVTDWLDRIGITDGGFSPPTTGAALKSDPRRSWKLDVSLPGLSSLPTVDKVREKMAKIAAWKAAPKGKEPKCTASERMMVGAVERLDAFLVNEGVDLDALTNGADGTRAVLEAFVTRELKPLDEERRVLLGALSQAAIVAICGGEWFQDLKPGEGTVSLDIGEEKPIVCGIGIEDVEIAL